MNDKIEIVAFSGLPIEGACGLRRPVCYDHESGEYFGYNTRDKKSAFKSEKFEWLICERLVTPVTPQRLIPCENVVMLYAHPDFVTPFLQPPLPFDTKSQLYLAFVPYDRAMEIQNSWCITLLNNAREALAGLRINGSVVEYCLRRARFCTAEVPGGELRKQVIILQSVLARLGVGSLTLEQVLEDASLDFSSEVVESIREESKMKAGHVL